MKEDAIKHPQCIPWDLSSDYNAQTLSHLSKNSHEKAPFDLARGLAWDPLWAGLRRLGAIIFSLSQLSSVIVLVFVLLFL
ncbi:hypothetical protein ACN42_g6119 [Penicillium freii]|uniref:Uncharacterized protein n=1 Tax=Penicillium freii TaxID=48697 RepID=A0A101MI64_PENFR|nr:hypothetical protein ACN42_g6119 [Penicillium freii]